MNTIKTPKVFLSYSHHDKHVKNKLITHFATAINNKALDIWHDQAIDVGSNLDDSIRENLNNSDVVLLLVTSNFLASQYCIKVELCQAMEAQERGEKLVIPIIAKECDWLSSELKNLKAAPDDGKAIWNHSNKDKAFTCAVRSIVASVNKLRTKSNSLAATINNSNSFTPEFAKFLNENRYTLSNNGRSIFSLTDIFIEPELQNLKNNHGEKNPPVALRKFIDELEHSSIYGLEQSGKTSIAKFIIKSLLEQGKLACYLDLNDVEGADAMKMVGSAMLRQYGNQSLMPHLVILDNVSKLLEHPRLVGGIISQIRDLYQSTLLLGDMSLKVASSDRRSEELHVLDTDTTGTYSVSPFGSNKRRALITKWVECQKTDDSDELDALKEVDKLSCHIDTLLRRSVIPAYPPYLLMLLQATDSFQTNKISEITSHAHCYQFLIYQSLERGKVKNSEVETYINLLTKLAGYMFNLNRQLLTPEDVTNFSIEYEKSYLLKDELKAYIKVLSDCSILIATNGFVSFKLNYIYYFYAAKDLSELYTKNKDAGPVGTLINDLHKQDNANIIVFITHHCKSPFFLNEIKKCLDASFAGANGFSLEDKEVAFIDEFIHKAPQLVISSNNDYKKNQAEADKRKDMAEAEEEKMQPIIDNLERDNYVARVIRMLKGIEVAGQIIRNRHGSLEKQEIKSMTLSASDAAMRFLGDYLDVTKTNQPFYIKELSRILACRRAQLDGGIVDDEGVMKEARELFLTMNYCTISAVLKVCVAHIGIKETLPILNDIAKERGTPVFALMVEQVHLRANRTLDEGRINKLLLRFKPCGIKRRLLMSSIVEHVSLNPVKLSEKEMISSKYGIKVLPNGKLEQHSSSKFHN